MKTYSDKQLEVINIESGYNMVLAGPGCGKTDILAERIARAYNEKKADLSDMLCLTFTNRAARGMFERIQTVIGSEVNSLFVGNLHRYCSHFLFDNSIVSAETTVLDELDTAEILDSLISDNDLEKMTGMYHGESFYDNDLYGFDWRFVNELLGITITCSNSSTGLVKSNKARLILKEARRKVFDFQHLLFQLENGHPIDNLNNKDLLTVRSDGTIRVRNGNQIIYKTNDPELALNNNSVLLYQYADRYRDYKIQHHLLDFDDLLLQTYNAYLKDDKKELPRYKWLQIDEIQDLSNFQIALVDRLTNKDDDFVVLYLGDEQQAIYSFMGAYLSTLDMLKSRCGKNIYRLDKNFRSPKYLLDLYNEYASECLNVDDAFLPKPKDNRKADFYDICFHAYDSLEEEAERIYNVLLPFLSKNEDEKIALLVPWNRDAEYVSSILKEKGVHHFKISGADSFQTVHIKTLLAHLNAVDNDFNLVAWSRILFQTHAVTKLSGGRRLIRDLRNIAMCPSDLLMDDGSYLMDFVRYFDNEEIVLYDTETTGVDVFADDIVQIAAVKIKNGEIVPNSEFNIFLELADRPIPEKLGKLVNPMVEEYKTARKYSKCEGLDMFMRYAGNSILMGHNVNYDYNILRYNLKRYCNHKYDNFEATIIDTLKLAHLIEPNQRRYKLGCLLESLGLDGSNSHMADDDILATYSLAVYCRNKAGLYVDRQKEFLKKKSITGIKKELEYGYKLCYQRAKRQLYELYDDKSEFALIKELNAASAYLINKCEIKAVESLGMILHFLKSDVLSYDVPNALKAHFQKHLMDLSTFREAEMCGSDSFKEKVFVSTVHKSKGLEFENVIVMMSTVGRYPHFAHNTIEQQEEDKRLFYVAISRAKKKLIVTGNFCDNITPFIYPVIHHFTVRFRLNTFLLEINDNILRVKYAIGDTPYSRDYYDFDKIYSFYCCDDPFQALKNIRIQYNSIIEYSKDYDEYKYINVFDRLMKEIGLNSEQN